MAFNQFDRSELLDAVRAGDSLDLIRESVEMVLQALIDAKATAFIGAEPHERTDTRTNQRDSSRSRLLATKAGDVNLAIPKLRPWQFLPVHPRSAPSDRCRPPASSGSFPTTPPCSASSPPWSPRPTTNGRSPNAATSPREPWPASTTSPPPSNPPR